MGKSSRGKARGNGRVRAVGRTHVSENDLRVFLWRLDTAMRAASCDGSGGTVSVGLGAAEGGARGFSG